MVAPSVATNSGIGYPATGVETNLTQTAAGPLDSRTDHVPVCVVIAYDDFLAYRRARHTLANVYRELGDEGMELKLVPCRFETLTQSHGPSADSPAADLAEIIMISVSAPATLPESIRIWLPEYLARRGDAAGAVVALLGSPDQPDRPTSPRYQFVLRTAYQAGWAFFAPTLLVGDLTPATS